MTNKFKYNPGIDSTEVAAAVLSYFKWHSVGYAIVHGFLGVFYLLYYVIRYGLKVGN